MDVLELHRRADDVEQPRLDADLHAERLRLADDGEQALAVEVAGRDDDAVRVVRADERGDHRARLVRRRQLGHGDRAHDVGVERPAVAQLLRDAQQPLGLADHDAALGLGVGDGDVADDRAEGAGGQAERGPQRERLLGADAAVDEGLAPDEDDERVERRQVEERGALVEGRLREDDLVAVVEAHEPAGHDDEREDGQRLRAHRVVAEELDPDDHRERRRQEVGEHEQAAQRAVALGDGDGRVALADVDAQRGAGQRAHRRTACPHEPSLPPRAGVGRPRETLPRFLQNPIPRPQSL